MKIKITFGELLDRGKWMQYCDMTGLSEWAMRDGLADSDEYPRQR